MGLSHVAPLLLRHNAQARRRAPTPVSSGLDVLITGPCDLVPANSLAFPSPLVVVSQRYLISIGNLTGLTQRYKYYSVTSQYI